jgi:hypothetical protein
MNNNYQPSRLYNPFNGKSIIWNGTSYQSDNLDVLFYSVEKASNNSYYPAITILTFINIKKS